MIPIVRSVLALLLLATGLQPLFAQTPFSASYPFTSITTGTGLTDPTAVPTATGVTFGAFSAVQAPGNPYSMSANPNAGGRFSFTGWPTGATNASDVFTGSINTAQYFQVTVTPQPGYSLTVSDISFTLQRSGTGIRQYAVRSSIDGYASNLPASISPANAALTVLANQTFQTTDANTVASTGSLITLGVNHAALSGAVSFRFYGFNAEASGGTFSIDNVVINGSTALSGSTPVISLSTTSIQFPGTNMGATSNAISYTVNGSSLQGPVTLATTAPFTISADDISYSTSLNISQAEATATKTIYVKASPTLAQAYTGTITHNSTGAVEKTVSLAVQGIDPLNLQFDFNSCTSGGQPGSGFVQYSVTGAQVWNCTTFGYGSTNGVNMNGFSGGAQNNEDWLISPALNLSSGFNIPVLRFYSRAEFSGPNMQVLVSTNYIGAGDPNLATWVVLPANLSAAGSNVWKYTDNVDLSAYKTAGVYIAFKYTSSTAAGAARWTIDDVSIANATQIMNISPAAIDFGEQSVATNGAGQPISVNVKGYGNLNFSTTAGWQLSADNSAYNSSLVIPEATAATGTTIYARFSPVEKKLRDTAILKLLATGFDDTVAIFTGSSYPKSETLDVAAWNMMFFGSNSTNTATQPFKEQQKQNAKLVLSHLNADLVGVEEISSDSLMNQLIVEMPGYASVLSPRYSYSFNGPDPNFPPQKVGFIYNTATLSLVETRVMFEALYDVARTGGGGIPSYPTAEGASSFWSSGRLPFMATFTTNIGGVNKTIRAVVIHAKSGGSTAEEYNRRVYDLDMLKDSLDAYYAGENIIILGDYNDDIIQSTYNSSPSPYKPFYDDAANYAAITSGFSAAGKSSYIGGSGSMIDHFILSNETNVFYLANSADVEDARNYVTSYSTTTSDHLPIYSRYTLDVALPVVWQSFNGWLQGDQAMLQWQTASEINTSYFAVERSQDGVNFLAIGKQKAWGNSPMVQTYQYADKGLKAGVWYYRIRQVDADGKYTLSKMVKIQVKESAGSITMYPNPVRNSVSISLPAGLKTAQWTVVNAEGKTVLSGNGTADALVRSLQANLPAMRSGIYVLQVQSNLGNETLKWIKE
ncbi:MAG TPA: choice-of-anchor J domain-containing protein [Phnomibacter sp.]|nr:choice-of-anchor J domain-containing protein [Phnomibacter sp.]